VLAGDPGAARAGVGRHQHDAELGGEALRPRLDHEGLFRAGQPGEIGQHRHLALRRLLRREDSEARLQPERRRRDGVIPHRPAEAALLGDRPHLAHDQFKLPGARHCEERSDEAI
jgi:hypothetical protein